VAGRVSLLRLKQPGQGPPSSASLLQLLCKLPVFTVHSPRVGTGFQMPSTVYCSENMVASPTGMRLCTRMPTDTKEPPPARRPVSVDGGNMAAPSPLHTTV
jgi:hypothetical protein